MGKGKRRPAGQELADDYHRWVLGQMQNISDEIGQYGTAYRSQFIELFTERVIKPVLENPRILGKPYWE
jgi:hypothetical protein